MGRADEEAKTQESSRGGSWQVGVAAASMRNCTVACCTQCSRGRFSGFPVGLTTDCSINPLQPMPVQQWRAAVFAICSPTLDPPFVA
jgi:hypothetical protein